MAFLALTTCSTQGRRDDSEIDEIGITFSEPVMCVAILTCMTVHTKVAPRVLYTYTQYHALICIGAHTHTHTYTHTRSYLSLSEN